MSVRDLSGTRHSCNALPRRRAQPPSRVSQRLHLRAEDARDARLAECGGRHRTRSHRKAEDEEETPAGSNHGMSDRVLFRVPAIEIRQGPRRLLYSFAVDGKLLPKFTTISRVRRDEASTLFGYQRPEVLSHI